MRFWLSTQKFIGVLSEVISTPGLTFALIGVRSRVRTAIPIKQGKSTAEINARDPTFIQDRSPAAFNLMYLKLLHF
jgi:hypothetical protein